MNLLITLRDTNKKYSNYTLYYKVRNDPLGKLWAEHLYQNFLCSNHPLEKTYCLQGWVQDWNSNENRNLNYLCNRINYFIKNINTELPKHGYPHIDLEFTVEKLQQDSQEELLNKIHHHFEILIGQVWEVSEWYKLNLSSLTRYSIRMLNNYCHEIEALIRSINNKRRTINLSLNGINSEGKHFKDKLRSELSLNEYNCFQDDMPFGCISLYYAQLGKSHIEVYRDEDTDIERKNISGIRYVTGEAIIPFYSSKGNLQDSGFVKWLKDNDWDINDPTLALKHGVVADLQYTNKDAILEEISKRNDVYQIYLNGKSKVYNYTWQDEEQWETKL